MHYPRTYGAIHTKIARWIEEGKLLPEYKDSINYNSYTQLDFFIFRLLGYNKTDPEGRLYISANAIAKQIENDIYAGRRNFDWLFGPHGLALFKALLIRERDSAY